MLYRNVKVLFVDDDQNILNGFKRNLRNEVIGTFISNPVEAVAHIKSNFYHCIVSDYAMPEMDGISFLTKAREILPDTSRILLTGFANLNVAIESVNLGNVFRFLTKPCPQEILLNAIEAGYNQYQLINSEKVLLEKTLKGSIRVLVEILTVVNPLAFSRTVKIKDMAVKIAKRLNYGNTWEVEIASLLSQIGTIGIPVDIVKRKYLGKELSFTDEQLFLTHPVIANTMLKNIPRLENVCEGILYQLKDYKTPELVSDPISGSRIPFIGRVLNVVTAYVTLLETGIESQAAVQKLKQIENAFDPVILAALDSEIQGVIEGYYIQEVEVDNINDSMFLAENIQDKQGIVYLAKGQPISEILKIRLQNYAKIKAISGKVKVLAPLENRESKN